MNLLLLDSGDYKPGDTITLTVSSVLTGGTGFVAEVSPEGAETEAPEETETETEKSPEVEAILKGKE